MKRAIGVVGVFSGLMILSSAEPAQAQVVPERFEIRGIDYYGPACPRGSGSATVDISSDRRSFVVTYTRFQAQAGRNIPLTESSKTCTLIVDLNYPSGWTWAAADIAYRGNVNLGPGVFADLRLRYSFPGMASVSQRVSIMGPLLGDFQKIQPLDGRAWAPCGGAVYPMTVNATASVNNGFNPSQPGLLTVEQTDGTFKVIFRVDWNRC
jgi:hypothetical protein